MSRSLIDSASCSSARDSSGVSGSRFGSYVLLTAPAHAIERLGRLNSGIDPAVFGK